MEDEYNFDLPTLLRTRDLDIRKLTRNNAALSVRDYFGLLHEFMDNTPLIVETINRIASQKGNENDFRNMADIKKLAEGIGCYKIIPVIDDIINADRRGHNKFAAECAKKILDDVYALSKQITAAKKTDDVEDADTPQEDQVVSLMAHPLKKVLQILDHEESTRKMRILAVDDAPVILKTISSVLSDDYKIYGMTDSTKLENFLRQITPELFLLDYKMPVLSGFDLIPIIRSFDEHKNTPIIFLTSMGTTEHVSAALALGACDFIIKPFQGNILREKVAKHIVRKKLF